MTFRMTNHIHVLFQVYILVFSFNHLFAYNTTVSLAEAPTTPSNENSSSVDLEGRFGGYGESGSSYSSRSYKKTITSSRTISSSDSNDGTGSAGYGAGLVKPSIGSAESSYRSSSQKLSPYGAASHVSSYGSPSSSYGMPSYGSGTHGNQVSSIYDKLYGSGASHSSSSARGASSMYDKLYGSKSSPTYESQKYVVTPAYGAHRGANLGHSSYSSSNGALQKPHSISSSTSYSHSSKRGESDSSIETKKAKTKLELQSSSNESDASRRVCVKKPKNIMNAAVKCTLIGNKCTAKCSDGYQFPTGETSLRVLCSEGEWSLEKYEWNDDLSCEPICSPPCKNKGVCIQPGQCTCPENFVGPYCEHEKKLCLDKPFVPTNSKVSCTSTTCSVSCITGYRFPDGSSITNLICKDGKWVPSRPELNAIPNCQPVCKPECQNGGACLSYNVCQCPQDFRGKQCQFNVDVCSPKKLNFNGIYNCSGDNDALRCSLSCPVGIEFSSIAASLYACHYERGYFEPSPIPQCNFSSSMEVISGGGMSQSSYKAHAMEENYSKSSNASAKLKNRKKIQHQYDEDYDEEDESYEKIITKTKIKIKTGRKGKRRGGKRRGGESEDDEEFEKEEEESFAKRARKVGVYSLYVSGNVTVLHRIPKPASCYTWNGNKVKTFDGLVYTRKLHCSHVLVQDRIDGTFSIILRSCEKGAKQPCPHAIDILLLNDKYSIENKDGNVTLTKDGKNVQIPTQLSGIRVTKTGANYKIQLELIGVSLLWDTEKMVSIEVTAGLFNRTAGLCGTLNQNVDDDFTSKDGSILTLASTFVDSWQTITSNDVTDNCSNDMQNDESLELVCPDDVKAKATVTCRKLLNSEKLAKCLEVMNEEAMIEACMSDYCYCSHENREKCACDGITVFAKDCLFKGIQLNEAWRDMSICPLPCKSGRIYKACGPSFEPACGSAVEDIIGTNCNEGCFCADGTVQYNGECIRIDDCPCQLRGKTFAPGKQIQKDCNKCKCDKGMWKCSDQSCGARCGAIGDPHYITFDGKHFDFMGKCSYYLLKRDNFTIEAENVACPGSISEVMSFGASKGVDLPSCTKSVTIKILGKEPKVIQLRQGRQLVIDGTEITKLPIKIFDGLMRIRHASSIITLVAFRDGLKVWWDGMTRVYIDAPASYRGQTQGLCGTFDSNQKNDFLTPEGDIESSVVSFANKWRTKESCDFIKDDANVPHPCQVNMENKERALKLCANLKSKLFEECHWAVDPEPFYEDCLYDMCACKGDSSACLCPILAAYSNECGRQGTIISWRPSVSECSIKCPAGQVYEECADKCFLSCDDIESTQPCKTKCVEGCRCPNGEALDDKNECIPIGLCPCPYQGLSFNAGYKETRPGRKHLELCACSGAIWNCTEATDLDKEKYPPAADVRSRCLTLPNQEFTTCAPLEQKTCKNMHTYQPKEVIECRPGCVCKTGFVLDVALNECVHPEQCSCHHGSKSYSDGEVIKSDCNTCKCKGGAWDCTTRPCPAICVAWGDSHFETYDGKDFDFQGACNYVLSKGALDSGDGFTVTIQNVLCGTNGVTCSKSVTFALLGAHSESVTLNSDVAEPGALLSKKDAQELVVSGPLKRMSIHQAGVFVVIEVVGMGVQLKWDRGTRIYVQLQSKWKGRVQGLCGNYDGDAMNDLKSPSSGVETNPMIFGNSWKLEEFCPKPTEQIDACEMHPERQIWAEKKCGVLKSDLFAKCHSEVSIDKYVKRCVYDACACDQGGDCECLCTALAAYAHECTLQGVPIKWRSPSLCPMQCDGHCSEYKPCLPACPLETCDMLQTQAKDQMMCKEDACVEGCAPKPCPDGEVYVNSLYAECMPKALCNPVCMTIDGKDFFEGNVTKSNDCQTCHCSKGKEVCIGAPCTPAVVQPKQADAAVNCKSGWSEWINQDQMDDETKAPNSQLKIGDIEMLPSEFALKNLNNSAFCPPNLMKQIECRMFGTHQESKLLGEDVECSLERGLLCIGECHDYEIRVLCDCEDNIDVFSVPNMPTSAPLIATTPSHCIPNAHIAKPGDCHKYFKCVWDNGDFIHEEQICETGKMFNPMSMICDDAIEVVKIQPECAPKKLSDCSSGKKISDCAVPCGRACHFYDKTLQKTGACTGTHNSCVRGCVPETAQAECDSSMLWRDENMCVKVGDCPCMSDAGEIVKPGAVVKESECKTCQCINNVYVCDTDSCEKPHPILQMASPAPSTPAEPPKHVISTLTPPPKCNPDNLVPMIDGENPLPDSALNASGYLSDAFKPQFSRLNTKATVDSSGSWSPAINDQMQYLQIGFDRPTPFFGVIIRGSPNFDQYVTSFKILHSHEGTAFHYLVDETSHPQIFSGPIDSRTPVQSMFKIPIEAKVLRIYPLTWHGSIAMRVELLGCSPIKQNRTLSHHVDIEEPPICDDPLGVLNGKLNPEQIKLSSFKSTVSPQQARESLRLSSDQGWRPNVDSPNEFVLFDFMELRNITGVETKGGKFGWVSAYNVHFSPDLIMWNTVLNEEGAPKIFLGNFDAESPKVNHFKFPIKARAMKIVPVKWNECIELRVEPIGCFVPYPMPKPEVRRLASPVKQLPPVATPACGACPGLPNESAQIDGICLCAAPSLWLHGECVQKTECPCIVDTISYEVGAIFEKDDCSSCVCMIGGSPQCKPQQCPSCGPGLRRSHNITCTCVCEPCPEGEVLCPTSGACIPAKSWCDGLQDCPDDEVNCPKKSKETKKTIKIIKEKTIIQKTCPEPICPPGFSIKLNPKTSARKLSPMLDVGNGHIGMYHANPKKVEDELSAEEEAESSENDECQEFECIPDRVKAPTYEPVKCPTANCPNGYEVKMEPASGTQCPKYKCEPTAHKDAICNVTGRTINTFDETEYKYDICDHILARDLETNNWTISLRLHCSYGNVDCKREVVIDERLCNIVIVLYTDLTLKIDGYSYTAEQLQKSPYKQLKTFLVSKVGDSIIFVSHLLGFWVRLNEVGDVKVGVSSKHEFVVDGLCGFYNGFRFDDKRLPNGSIVLSTADFGDSWIKTDAAMSQCEQHSCPEDVHRKALEMCETVRDEMFSICSKSVNIDHYISRCVETACDCLKAAGNDNSCKCNLLKTFVTECMAADSSVHLDTWRTKFDCGFTCKLPLMHNDCYQRRCEPSCDTLKDQDCPFLPGTCFSGCYCPAGTVRKGENCVPVNECKNCVCDGFGRTQFISYDRKNFTFVGNCTYLLTRDILIPDQHTFQVFATLDACSPSDQMHSCVQALHVLYGKHTVQLKRNGENAIATLIDDVRVQLLPFKADWLTVVQDEGKGLNLNFIRSQMELSVLFKEMSFSIRLPNIKYATKLEGLCGDCNGEPLNDLQMNRKSKLPAKDGTFADIIESWLSDEPRLKTETICRQITPTSDCPVPPIELDACQALLRPEMFGKCHRIVDPKMYISLCQAESCKNSSNPCTQFAAYARECSRKGICLDWKRGACKENDQCPVDMEWKTCACPHTCDTIAHSNSSSTCDEPSDGCFCRSGLAMKDGKCVLEKNCSPCDDKGHVIGDVWHPEKCTECTCKIDGQTDCVKQQCASTQTICQIGFKPILVDAEHDCCPKYNCVPEPRVETEECEDAPVPVCTENQFAKMIIDDKNCSKFVCDCKPMDQCKPTMLRNLLPGEFVVKEVNGCCPASKILCDKSKCPPKPTSCAQEFFEARLVTENVTAETCCPQYKCVAPSKSCIVEINGKKTLKTIGEIWSSATPCMHQKCTYGPGGSFIVANESQPCPVFSCALGAKLVIPDGKCCGECVQQTCIVNGVEHQPGEEWKNEANCTTYKCVLDGKQMVVMTSQPTCGDVSNCSAEDQVIENCCAVCKMRPQSQKTCLPVSLSDSETVGVVEQVKGAHGKCINTQPIRGFTECHGTCPSGTKYNRQTLRQDKKCTCCSISQHENINVPVKCEDGIHLTIPISVPKMCDCTACEEHEQPNYHAYEFLKSSAKPY